MRLLDAIGTPFEEVHREPGATTLLALVGNAFYTVQVGDKEALLIPRSPGAYAIKSLDFSAAPKRRGLSFDHPAGLFATPYGAAWLGGFLAGAELLAPVATRRLDVAHAVEGSASREAAARSRGPRRLRRRWRLRPRVGRHGGAEPRPLRGARAGRGPDRPHGRPIKVTDRARR